MSETSRSGIPLKPYYTPADLPDFNYDEILNDPGHFPFTRGQRAGRRGWLQRELSGEGTPARSNEQLKYLLRQGQMGLDIIGDAPTQAMMDPDHPLATHTVGTQGVSLCCLEDFRVLLDDIPLVQNPISSSCPPIFALAGLYLIARERDFPPERLRGSVLQVPLYAEDCGYSMKLPFSLRMRLAGDSIAFAADRMPRFHAFLEDTYFFSEAGLNAVEEMALGFVEIRAVVRELLRRGIDVDRFAPRIAILVNCSMDLFEEIAKIRATRRLFARMMREEFGAQEPRSWAVVITSHTSGLTLTAQQPVNNIVRGAIQTVALALAGVQAVEISAFDEAYRTPGEEAHLVGIRTQQIAELEAGVSKVQDPLGGSYFIETLTNEMEQRIRAMVEEIEALGEPGELAESGWFRRFFESTMRRYQQQINDGEQMQVGVNIHQMPEEEDTLLKEVVERKVEPSWERIEWVKQYKQARNQQDVVDALRHVYRRAKVAEVNLMEPIVEAVAAGATFGEIAGVLRQAYGWEYDPFGYQQSPL